MTVLETLHCPPRWPWHALLAFALSQLLALAVWLIVGWGWGLAMLLASHALFLLPVFLPNSGFYTPVVRRLADLPDTVDAAVWLTIDDGPGPDTPAVLDLLDRYGASATFFVVGERAAAQPEQVRELLRRGHQVGNHSYSHPERRFWRLGPRAMAREIGLCQQAVQAITGQAPRWYRSVVGMTNPFVGPLLAPLQLTRVGWSARGFDGVDCTPGQVLARLLPALRPGAVVLLHEGSGHGHNLAIIEGVLKGLEERGLRTCLPPEPSLPAGN